MILSIIIPTFNRAASLRRALKSIEDQSENTDTEVIVIDNGSTDETKSICLAYEHKINNFNYIYDAEPGLLTGRHIGAKVATGEILCFLDDDVELNPNYIQNLIELFLKDQSLLLATGPCLPNYETPPPEWLNYMWSNTPQGKFCGWLSLIDFGEQIIEIDPNLVWGLNFVIRKSALIALGGFHPDSVPNEFLKYQGDGETGLTLKAIKNNYKAFYFPGLALKHYVPTGRLTISYFKRRSYIQGISNAFTSIRNDHYNPSPPPLPPNPFKSLRNKLHPYYRWMKKIYEKSQKSILPDDIKNLILSLKESEKEGYNFLQNHFRMDEGVKNWILKENYWDYNLPTK